MYGNDLVPPEMTADISTKPDQLYLLIFRYNFIHEDRQSPGHQGEVQ
jgi:hypothetical protein